MQLRKNKRWTNLLGWIADHPRASALAATLLLGVIASVIRAPVIEGSFVEHMSDGNKQLEIARQISAAAGNASAAVVILTPSDVPVETIFADLDGLAAELSALDPRVELRSINSARAQLFAFDLSLSSPIGDLLLALRGTPEGSALINAGGASFLVAISSPDELKFDVLEVLAAHNWNGAYAGNTVLASAQLDRDVVAGLKKDLRLLLPVIVVVGLLALLAAFSSWRALLLPFFASVASAMVAFALFSVLAIPINLVTLLALPIVLIVGLANSCHFLAKSESETSSRQGVDAVVRSTLQRVGPPFFFSTLTTAIALASLVLNEVPAIANLGLVAAIALLIVFLLVLLAAPLSLRWYLSGSVSSWQQTAWFGALSRRLAQRRTEVSALLLLAMLAGAATIPLLSVKSEPRAFFPDTAPFSSALRVFETEFYAFSPLRVLLTFNNVEPLAALRAAGAVRDQLASVDGVRQVQLLPAVNLQNAYVLHALLAREGDLALVRKRLDATRGDAGMTLVYSNAALVYGDIDRQAMGSLLRSLGGSVALIFGSILVVFRSVRAVLGTMLANAVPLLLVCGAAWLSGNPLNLVTVFVFLVALGVIVDDSIHILFWREAGGSVSGSSIEFSVMLSTLMLCLGLLLCQLSDFPTTRQFAAYCALALLGAVVSNLSVLPLLLGAQPPGDGNNSLPQYD